MQFVVTALEKQAKTWKFIELWVDPIPFPPKILMLVVDHDGKCNVFNPAADYKLVVSHLNYQAAQEWFLEDEYERLRASFWLKKLCEIARSHLSVDFYRVYLLKIYQSCFAE